MGCGKKANESASPQVDKSVQPSKDEMYFNSLKEIIKAIENDNVDSLRTNLINAGAIDLNQILNNGETFLTLAIKKHSRKARNYLIEKGVSLEKANSDKETPLIVSVRVKSENSLQVLLDNKVDLEKVNIKGDSALLLAIKSENDDFSALLIKHGAKIETVDSDGKNAIKLCQDFDLPKTQSLIQIILKLDAGAPDIASFRTILENADIRSITTIVTRHPRIITDYESVNPLAVLVDAKDSNSALKSAELLIEHNANVDGPENAEITPLIKASKSLKVGFVNLFLNAKADPKRVDKDGKSALIHAIEANSAELVDILLANGALESNLKKDNKRRNACRKAYEKSSTLTNPEDKALNRKILNSLNCNLLDRFVESENGNQ